MLSHEQTRISCLIAKTTKVSEKHFASSQLYNLYCSIAFVGLFILLKNE